jgi:hypothetical protein
MICECGCPINIKPFKGGESITDIVDFAQVTLEVKYVTLYLICKHLFSNSV